MIWFNIKLLENELIEGNLSDKEGFNYLLANMIMLTVAPYLAGDRYSDYWMTCVQFLADIFITVIIIRTTYDINTKGDNRDYLKRFLGLSFVAAIRLAVYLVVVMLSAKIVMFFLEKVVTVGKGTKQISLLLFEIASGIAYYFMVTNSFKRVSEMRP